MRARFIRAPFLVRWICPQISGNIMLRQENCKLIELRYKPYASDMKQHPM